MKPWKMAAVLAASWVVVVLLAGIVHTEVVVRDLTPEQDEAISYRYGQAAGLGAIAFAIWGYDFQKRKRRR